MPKVLPAIFSYENMKAKFNQDNPDEPYTRRADLESGIYELDSWLIRVDDNNKAISTVGWKEHPSHTVVGGMYATAEGREIGGNSKALQNAREPQLNQSKPLVAAFGHRDGDNARWIANAKGNLWRFPDDPEFKQMKTLLPESVLNAWLAKYPERMAIRSIRDEGQMAKCMYLDDPTPAWFGVLKSKKRGWKDILKNLPPDDWTPYPYLEVDSASNNRQALETNIDGIKYIARGHYLTAVLDNRNKHGPKKTNQEEFPKWIECTKGLGKGKYWMYANDSSNNKDIILIDIIGPGDKFPASINRKDVNLSTRDYEGNPVKKVIIFSNYFNYIPQELSERTRIDCYPGINLKEGHKLKGSSITVKPDEEKPKTTQPTQVSSESSSRERERARKEIEKIIGKVEWSLPRGHIKPIIDERVKELEDKWPPLRRKEKAKIYRNLEEAY